MPANPAAYQQSVKLERLPLASSVPYTNLAETASVAAARQQIKQQQQLERQTSLVSLLAENLSCIHFLCLFPVQTKVDTFVLDFISLASSHFDVNILIVARRICSSTIPPWHISSWYSQRDAASNGSTTTSRTTCVC